MENNQNNQSQPNPQQIPIDQACKFCQFKRNYWNQTSNQGTQQPNDMFRYHGDPEYLGYPFNPNYDFAPYHCRGGKFRRHRGWNRHHRHYQNYENYDRDWNQRHSYMGNPRKWEKMMYFMNQPGGQDFWQRRQEFQNSCTFLFNPLVMSNRAQMPNTTASNVPNQSNEQK